MNLITNLITNPDEFFKSLLNQKPNLKKPAAIVLYLSLLAAIYQFKLMLKLSQALPESLQSFFIAGAIWNLPNQVNS